jgi:ABC-type glycerol-3-phosphate transport system substrate-binding protein
MEAEISGTLSGETAGVDGKIGAVYGNFYSFENYLDRYKIFGGTLGVYGLPSYDGRGPQTVSREFVCVTSDTKYPEACAEFVKVLLSYDVQCYKESNPINRSSMRYVSEQKLKAYNKSIEIESKYDKSVEKTKLTNDIIDKYEEVLSSSYGGMSEGSAIESILMEESSSYFNGQKSMDDVITVMQKRLQTVLDEAK